MMFALTRRGFARALAALTLSGASRGAAPAPSPPSARTLAFPDGFIWGCATSAYQIEGAANQEGRGPSIWDTFAHLPGKTHDGDTGDIACNSYHRYKEDVQLLADLGAKAYRFSISWSRVLPTGRGKTNPKGLDYYDRLIDDLLKHGIEPWPTLFHWDLPQALKGGWEARDTCYAFADYAGFMSKRLADRVGQFMTTNEFGCFTDLGYLNGQFAPGLRLEESGYAQVRHHGVLAHGLAVQAIRAHAPGSVKVGMAENPKVLVPVMDTPAHVEAAKRAFREENAPFLTAVLEGKYTDAYLARLGPNAPRVMAGDMAAIGSPLDFVGLNVYQPEYASASSNASGYTLEKKPASFPHMSSPWLFLGPEVMYWAVRHVTDIWGVKAIYITENGCSSSDARTSDGQIDDLDRVMYLRNHLTNLQRAAAEGCPIKGYFLWSLLDNFEWLDGFGQRFGITYIDFATQNRTPKLSSRWYRNVIERNAVV